MAFQIDDAHLPAVLTASPMTDEEFVALCAEHPDLSLEVSADGELIVMPLTHPVTGMRNSRITHQLEGRSEQDGRGSAFDWSTGFVLPNGARRSPDASWIRNEKIDALDAPSFEGYWRFCPDFVIELKSQTDRPRTLRAKMTEWIANGAQLGWLIDPETIEIYRPGSDPEIVTGVEKIEGTGPVEGFVLDLRRG
ncbi:MAG: Uma2 family endonuclease [Bryobacteraceae bacterium]